MQLSFFIAKWLGLFYFITSFLFIFREEMTIDILDAYFHGSKLKFLDAVIAITLGLAIVLLHNEWMLAWPVLITLMGWFMLLVGVIELFCMGMEFDKPEESLLRAGKITGYVMLVIGLVFMYFGFFA